jgi:hypothetical protein
MRSSVTKLLNDKTPATEPAFKYGTLVTLVVSLLGLGLSYFFPHLSVDAKYAIMTAAAVFVPVITGLLIRFKVWSPATVQAVIEEIQNDYTQVQGEIKPTKSQTPKLL